MMDDCDRLRFAPRVKNPEKNARKPYAGNANPSQHEYAAEGYETLVKAEPASYRGEDRETLSEDTEYDPNWVRRI